MLRSEFLGYLPFGVYQWLECAGKDISNGFVSDWPAQIMALETTGHLVLIEAWQNPEDEFESKITYALHRA
jgi:hypothetical protein